MGELERLRECIGRTEEVGQVCNSLSVARMAALLDWKESPVPGDVLPPLWHWCLFAPQTPTRELAVDGHPAKGGFLPDVPLPRRMWAGSRIRYLAPLYVGEMVQRVSTIRDVQVKRGRSGTLVFVTVHHAWSAGGVPALDEEQDIVYRERAGAGAAPSVQEGVGAAAQFSREVTPHPVLLFRYSALTFNAHRIHYDRDYAMREEGYPGLVVQAPLTATLLTELLRGALPDAGIAALRFRAVQPLFDGAPVVLCGRRDGSAARLWATTPTGQLALEMDVELETTHA